MVAFAGAWLFEEFSRANAPFFLPPVGSSKSHIPSIVLESHYGDNILQGVKRPQWLSESRMVWSGQTDQTYHSHIWNTRQMVTVIDKSLDLEKISRRNDSYFSLSSWRIVFSFLFSIFKILRKKFSFYSRFMRF